MMADSITLWRRELDPASILADPHVRPASTLMAVAAKLGAVSNMLGTFNADHPEEREYGLAVANMAVRFALAVLDHLALIDDGGPAPPIINLKMAQRVVGNLLAVVRGHLEEWKMAAYQEDGIESEIVSPKRNSAGGLSADGQLAIAHWADLGIGIDDDWTYRAFSPCPATAELVKLKDGVVLPLVGERWKKVLECFASSTDGKMARRNELLVRLGKVQKGEVSEDQAVYDEGLVAKAKSLSKLLSATMADLARELRECVATTNNTTVFESNGDTYKAAFTTRHLFRDGDGNITFGRAI